MTSHNLLFASWLDDQNGPAKLTARQQELLAGLEDPAKQLLTLDTEPLSQATTVAENKSIMSSDSSASTLANLLTPHWEPNEILKMFYEERENVIKRGNECKQLVANVDSVLKDILALKDLYLYVSPRTSQLHSECKNIIQERNDLKESYERISTTLVKQEELRSIFRRMPEIKNQIIQVLNKVLQNYQTDQQQQQQQQQKQSLGSSGTATGATPLDEYYGRFFIECRRIKELTSQLESCLSSSSTQEILLHLEEIYTLYFDIREQLIEPVFTKSIKNLISKADRNYCDLLKQTCSVLIRTLRNELQLFNQIFSTTDIHSSKVPIKESTTTTINQSSEESNQQQQQAQSRHDLPIKRQAIDDFLGLLCKIFYEHLRPIVIHVNHLETLTELYKLISDTMRPEVAEDCYRLTMSALAEDIQERMVFRAEIFMQESVLDYKPSGGDLAYPEKLEIVQGGELKNYQSMWYPTVQRTVLALFYLNRVFDPITFRELAQEVVLACFKSLDIAQKLVDLRHGGTKIEASLFLSKHLEIIRDQLLGYGIERIQFPTKQPDTNQQQQIVSNNNSKQTNNNNNMFELDTSDLESMLRLFQQHELDAASSESTLWSQLNETIVSGTRWTLRATRIKQ